MWVRFARFWPPAQAAKGVKTKIAITLDRVGHWFQVTDKVCIRMGIAPFPRIHAYFCRFDRCRRFLPHFHT